MKDNNLANINKVAPILLVGGGTGGHIYPLVAIAEELIRQNQPFIFVGDSSGRERQIVEESGWAFVGIKSGKIRRDWSVRSILSNVVDFGRFVYGFIQSINLISRSRARIVFSKGGYVAMPVVLAAKLLGKKIVIHESDAVMGLTNQISASMASKVFTAFAPEVFPNQSNKFEQVGIPIRLILRRAAQLKAPQKSRPIIFILAGIQGSSAINALVRSALPSLLPIADVIHITGEAEAGLHKSLVSSLPKKFQSSYKPFSFITRELPYYYQSANIIVSRASATTIAEAALFAKAMYLIPLPSSARNHQLKNAKYLQSAGAAILREQRSLSEEIFVKDILRVLSDKTQQDNLGQRLNSYFKEEDSVERITRYLLGEKHQPTVSTSSDTSRNKESE